MDRAAARGTSPDVFTVIGIAGAGAAAIERFRVRTAWQGAPRPACGYQIHTSWSLSVVPNLIRRKSSSPRRMTWGPGLP